MESEDSYLNFCEFGVECVSDNENYDSESSDENVFESSTLFRPKLFASELNSSSKISQLNFLSKDAPKPGSSLEEDFLKKKTQQILRAQPAAPVSTTKELNDPKSRSHAPTAQIITESTTKSKSGNIQIITESTTKSKNGNIQIQSRVSRKRSSRRFLGFPGTSLGVDVSTELKRTSTKASSTSPPISLVSTSNPTPLSYLSNLVPRQHSLTKPKLHPLSKSTKSIENAKEEFKLDVYSDEQTKLANSTASSHFPSNLVKNETLKHSVVVQLQPQLMNSNEKDENIVSSKPTTFREQLSKEPQLFLEHNVAAPHHFAGFENTDTENFDQAPTSVYDSPIQSKFSLNKFESSSNLGTASVLNSASTDPCEAQLECFEIPQSASDQSILRL